eukprot:1183345-Prorocentrum_minimum.AAC.2
MTCGHARIALCVLRLYKSQASIVTHPAFQCTLVASFVATSTMDAFPWLLAGYPEHRSTTCVSALGDEKDDWTQGRAHTRRFKC